MEEIEEMSKAEKDKYPYLLLLDPVTRMAAAYSNTHELMAPLASAKLVAFAEANESSRIAWDEGAYSPPTGWRRPLPDWATAEVRRRCVLLWIKRGHASDDYYRSIPKK